MAEAPERAHARDCGGDCLGRAGEMEADAHGELWRVSGGARDPGAGSTTTGPERNGPS